MGINGWQLKEGAVAFIDALGWKGVWRSCGKDKTAPIKKMRQIIETIKSKDKVLREEDKSLDFRTDIVCISDTIVILNGYAEINKDERNELETKLINHTAKLSSEALKAGWEMSTDNMRIPLRGAIGYGDYFLDKDDGFQILIGSAIDDTASCHEIAEWMGVMLTPRCYSKFFKEKPNVDQCLINYKVPTKKGLINTKCVKWIQEPEEIKKYVSDNERVQDVTVYPKYANTIEFIEYENRTTEKIHIESCFPHEKEIAKKRL